MFSNNFKGICDVKTHTELNSKHTINKLIYFIYHCTTWNSQQFDLHQKEILHGFDIFLNVIHL